MVRAATSHPCIPGTIENADPLGYVHTMYSDLEFVMGIPTRLKKTGNSRAFPVSAGFIKAHHLDQIAEFDMDWRDGSIVITPRPVEDTSEEDAMIHALFADFGPEHVHRESLRTDRRGGEEF